MHIILIPLAGFNKLMIVGGYSSSNVTVSQFEIVDLSNKNSECQAISNVPNSDGNLSGGLALNQVPLVCDLGVGSSSK